MKTHMYTSQQKIDHIYWFAPYHLVCPSTRYRGKYPLEYLSKQYGITYDFFLPQRSLLGAFQFVQLWLSILLFRKAHSIIVFQKICTNRWYANALKLLLLLRPNRTLYDLDDAEYFRLDPRSLHFFLKHASTVSVGSKALQEYCQAYNANTYQFTSPVTDHKAYKLRRNKTIHIGWVGDFGYRNTRVFSHKTSMYQLLFPALKRITSPIHFSIIGIKHPADIPEIIAYFADCPHISLHMPLDLDWRNDGWIYSEIASFDIGVSPLINHLFNQSKSAFRAKQYLSVGVPTVASDVGENKRFVHHGKNGFLCQTSDDFYQRIMQVMNMPSETYAQMSQYAIQEKHTFSIESYCEVLLTAMGHKLEKTYH